MSGGGVHSSLGGTRCPVFGFLARRWTRITTVVLWEEIIPLIWIDLGPWCESLNLGMWGKARCDGMF